MPKVFFSEPMTNTPFAEPAREARFANTEIEVVDEPRSADVVVARTIASLRPFFSLEKRYYVWTHEPTWLSAAERHINDVSSGVSIAVSTAFNGDIYLNPLYYLYVAPAPAASQERGIRTSERTRECVFLGSYRAQFQCLVSGMNVDLSEYRQRLATKLHQDGRCDIFGRHWPNQLAPSNSRGPGWHQKKLEIIKKYKVNICIENTMAQNYVTEKIWDAISAGCVPVYFGRGSGVYDVLPREAFVDASELRSWEHVASRIADLTTEETEEIVRTGAQAMTRLQASYNQREVRSAAVKRFCERVEEEMSSRSAFARTNFWRSVRTVAKKHWPY